MKRTSLTLIAALSLSSAALSAEAPAEAAPADFTIEWTTDIDTALQRSAAEGKPILVDVYADWCGDSPRLDRLVFQDPEASRQLSAEFVLCRIDVSDWDGSGKAYDRTMEFFQEVEVDGIGHVVLRSDGTKIADFCSKVSSVDRYLEQLSEIMEAEANPPLADSEKLQ